jgi:hypothetical protein
MSPSRLYCRNLPDGRTRVAATILERKDGIRVFNMPTLMMLDFDKPSDRHLRRESITVQSLEDVERRLELADELLERHGLPPGPSSWELYETPGGYHAFRMDAEVPPTPAAAAFLIDIGVDPGYASLVRNTRAWPVRVTPKSEADYVARRLRATGETHCSNCLLQLRTHDALIEKGKLRAA